MALGVATRKQRARAERFRTRQSFLYGDIVGYTQVQFMSRHVFWCRDRGGRLVSQPGPLGRDRARLGSPPSALPTQATEHHGA